LQVLGQGVLLQFPFTVLDGLLEDLQDLLVIEFDVCTIQDEARTAAIADETASALHGKSLLAQGTRRLI
jgi:hypothetical protein